MSSSKFYDPWPDQVLSVIVSSVCKLVHIVRFLSLQEPLQQNLQINFRNIELFKIYLAKLLSKEYIKKMNLLNTGM